ncbi:unnamed protein product [Choristocarpus tenellus]
MSSFLASRFPAALRRENRRRYSAAYRHFQPFSIAPKLVKKESRGERKEICEWREIGSRPDTVRAGLGVTQSRHEFLTSVDKKVERLTLNPNLGFPAGKEVLETTSKMRGWQSFKEKLSKEAVKRILRDYGVVAVVFHSAVFSVTLGSFFGALSQGVDMGSILAYAPLIAENLPSPSAGNLAVAWGLTTVTGPARGVLTITLTPRVARFWRGDAKNSQARGDEKDPKERNIT